MGGSGMAGTLYVVATPIGNLEDLSARAARVLREVDLIAAEDTRRVRTLLAHVGAEAKARSFHAYSPARRLQELVAALLEGRDVALVSDAGTPCISDPGAELVEAAIEAGAKVVPVPGPCAAVVALSASGFSAGRFMFAGYPPRGEAERKRFVAQMISQPWPVVMYEAPGRTAALLKAIAEIAPGREVVLARELTKLHEEILRGKVEEVLARVEEKGVRGEVTIVVGPGEGERRGPDAHELARWLAGEGLAPGRIAAALVKFCGLGREEAYELARKAREGGTDGAGGM